MGLFGFEGDNAREKVIVLLTMCFALADPFLMRVGELTMRASVGHAVFPGDGETEAALLHVADEAMYARKGDRVDRPAELRRLA